MFTMSYFPNVEINQSYNRNYKLIALQVMNSEGAYYDRDKIKSNKNNRNCRNVFK